MLPAFAQQKWLLVTIATLLPATLIGVTLREQAAQAHQQASTNELTSLPDGVYLYGNSPQPNELTRSYVVFERRDSEVIGAFYSPQSEFTCFAGNLQGTRLDVEAIVLGQPETQEVRAQLANLYPLQEISANDQRMLGVCKQEAIALATRQ
ncbi:MAG: hypothetical protein ACM37W_10190 [Actinomycetota bacterium]